MDSLPSTPERQSFWNEVYANTVPFWGPPVSIGMAAFPSFYWYQVKCAMQAGIKAPPPVVTEIARGASGAAPILIAQMILQMVVERGLKDFSKAYGLNERVVQSPAFAIGSSMAVGGASVWALAVYSGRTIQPPIPIRESIRWVTWQRGRLIFCREACFFSGIASSEHCSLVAQKHFGEEKIVKYTAVFFSGAFGSFLGHPFDTALVYLQYGLRRENCLQLMRGASARIFSNGVLTVIFIAINDTLQGKKS